METFLLQKWYMAYRFEPFSMTLSDLQGHSSVVSLFNCDFSCSCAAVDKISTDIAHMRGPSAIAKLLVEIWGPVFGTRELSTLTLAHKLNMVSNIKAPFTRYNLLSNPCQTRLTTGLTNGCIVYTAGCQAGYTTRFDNRLNKQCCSFNMVVKPVVKPVWQSVWQPAISCIQTFNRSSNRLYNRVSVWQPAISCIQTFNRSSNRLYNRVSCKRGFRDIVTMEN